LSNATNYKPRSLAQHFEPSDGFKGCFAWVCGYSADSGFLNNAIERFTGKTSAQRAYEGAISVVLMLDNGNAQITPIEVPGLLHLPVKSPGDLPFKLLHAKVGILGFRHERNPQQWRIKLIVSTGNWTRSTLEESLDLAWCSEIGNEDLKVSEDEKEQVAADISAAWASIEWLTQFFDTRALHPEHRKREAISEGPTRELRKWLKLTKKFGRRLSPRFLDNRKAGFLEQLPSKIENCSSASARNYLAMGSGFYESTNNNDRVPKVLQRIVDRLREEGLLTHSSEIEIYVNAHGGQAVSTAMEAIRAAGWSIFTAAQPDYFSIPRSLHAKFIFGCTYRGNSKHCNSAWLYLGSGNLTHPGFTNSIHRDCGNFETAVVFSPKGLHWKNEKNLPPNSLLSNRLPIGDWEEQTEPDSLSIGDEMPERDLEFVAAPIAYLYWKKSGEGEGWLTSDPETNEQPQFELLDTSDIPCKLKQGVGFHWHGERPRQVLVRWDFNTSSATAWIPVIDEYGRIAASVLPKIGIEQAWEQLENFPMPPDDEDLREANRIEGGNAIDGNSLRRSGEVRYPIRQMMQLVENIAAKQTSVQRIDWTMWCRRFEQCLIQASESEVVAEFAKLELNPLSPLKRKPFRPKFAENDATDEGRIFEAALSRVQLAWDVADFADIGGGE